MKRFPYTVLAVILCLVLLVVAFTAGALKTGLNANSTPIVLGVIAMVAGIVPGLLSLLKSEQNGKAINETHEKVQGVKDDMENGVLQSKIENAIRKVREEEAKLRAKQGS